MPRCVKLFKKYKLTDQKKMVRWMNHNHTDHADARGSVQSQTLQDDYKFITGCFANRKKIFQAMKSSKSMKSKSKSKKKKVNEIKGGSPSTEELIRQINQLKGFLMNYYPKILRLNLEHYLVRYGKEKGGLKMLYDYARHVGVSEDSLKLPLLSQEQQRDALIPMIIKKAKSTPKSVLTEWFKNMSSEELDRELGVGDDRGTIRKRDAEWYHTPNDVKEIQLHGLIDIIQQKIMNSLTKLGIFSAVGDPDFVGSAIPMLKTYPIPGAGTQSDEFLQASKLWADAIADKYDQVAATRKAEGGKRQRRMAVHSMDAKDADAFLPSQQQFAAKIDQMKADLPPGSDKSFPDLLGTLARPDASRFAVKMVGQATWLPNDGGRKWYFRPRDGDHLTYEQIGSNIKIFDAFLNSKLRVSQEQWKQDPMIKAMVLEEEEREAEHQRQLEQAAEEGRIVEPSPEKTKEVLERANAAYAHQSSKADSKERGESIKFVEGESSNSSGQRANLTREEQQVIMGDKTGTLLDMYGRVRVGSAGPVPPARSSTVLFNKSKLLQQQMRNKH